MGKEKVTLTLSTDHLEDLRRVAGARSLSAAVDRAVSDYLDKSRHLAAVDDWLTDLEAAHGAIPPATVEWATQILDRWEGVRMQPFEQRHTG